MSDSQSGGQTNTRTVVITGANGQVGRELMRAEWPSDVTVVGLTSSELDITDSAAVEATIDAIAPAVIVNAAAYTAVDKAEDDEERATAVNGHAVDHLAAAADRSGALLVHYSTDYVFDGSKDGWYVEGDPLNPIGAYGRSKAHGEAAAASTARHLVLRTAWVYGALGNNFVTTMLRLASERDELGVVADQFGCPTSAADIAAATVDLVAHEAASSAAGVVHVASPDDADWHTFAMAVFDTSANGFSGVCKQLTTAEYPTKAVRPANSRLATDRLNSLIGRQLPSWRTSLSTVVAELESKQAHNA